MSKDCDYDTIVGVEAAQKVTQKRLEYTKRNVCAKDTCKRGTSILSRVVHIRQDVRAKDVRAKDVRAKDTCKRGTSILSRVCDYDIISEIRAVKKVNQKRLE